MRRRDAHRQPSLLAMHFDDAAWNAIELTRDQHTRRCRNLLAQSHGELVDALPAFDSDRGTRRAHHANLDCWSVHSPLQPTFKGVWSTVANFAPLLLPDTRCGQYPQPHK